MGFAQVAETGSDKYTIFNRAVYDRQISSQNFQLMGTLGVTPTVVTALFKAAGEIGLILLLTLIPGMHGQILDKLIDDYAAIIFQSFGVGGLPDGGEGEMAHSVGRWISAGKTILMMTQVPYEGSDMEIYQVGQQVKKRYPMLETYNMTMEAAVTKLMWILGQTAQAHEISHLFYQPVQHDLIR